MHNCKLTRNVLLDVALGELSPAQTNELLAELNYCAECQAEYATLKNTLRVSRQVLQSASPAEEFWPGYHARLQGKLRQQLEEADNPALSNVQAVGLSFTSRLWLGLAKMATTSVRVPVPVALAMMLLVGIFFFALRERGQATVTPATSVASVETRTVHVPVIQERVVTQVVYVKQKGRRSRRAEVLQDRPDRIANTSAGTRLDRAAKTAMSLVGFKPTDQVKLTIIKGSYQHEK